MCNFGALPSGPTRHRIGVNSVPFRRTSVEAPHRRRIDAPPSRGADSAPLRRGAETALNRRRFGAHIYMYIHISASPCLSWGDQAVRHYGLSKGHVGTPQPESDEERKAAFLSFHEAASSSELCWLMLVMRILMLSGNFCKWCLLVLVVLIRLSRATCDVGFAGLAMSC